MPKPDRAFIFDLDGTLVDTMPSHFVAWTEIATRHGLTFPEARFYSLGGVPTVERGAVKQSTELKEMLEYSLEVESLQVRLYTEAVALCGEHDVGLRVLLEDVCTEEQEGVDHLEKLLKKRELAIAGKNTTRRHKVG